MGVTIEEIDEAAVHRGIEITGGISVGQPGEVELQKKELVGKWRLVGADVGAVEVLVKIVDLVDVIIGAQCFCEKRFSETSGADEQKVIGVAVFQGFNVAGFVDIKKTPGADSSVSAFAVRDFLEGEKRHGNPALESEEKRCDKILNTSEDFFYPM